jgi:hypothetical protein
MDQSGKIIETPKRAGDKTGCRNSFGEQSFGSGQGVWNLESGKIYGIYYAGRSSGFGIDRWAFYLNGKSGVALDMNTPETKTETSSGGSSTDPGTDPNPPQEITVRSIDFDKYTGISGFVPYYKDNEVLAINTVEHPDQWAAAQYTYNDESYIFDVSVIVLVENDGETPARLRVAGEIVGDSIAPEYIDGKWRDETITWKDITINKGDLVQVETIGVSNQKVKESSGDWGYARGRWRSMTLTPVKAPTPVVKTGMKTLHNQSGTIRVTGHAVHVDNTIPNDHIQVFDLAGKTVGSMAIGKAGNAVVDLNGIVSGSYIVQHIRGGKIIAGDIVPVN